MSNPDTSMIPELILYYREGCHLCEDMEQLLKELLEPGSFRLQRIDIDEDPVLRERFNVRVPVLSLGVPVTDSQVAGSHAADSHAAGFRAAGFRGFDSPGTDSEQANSSQIAADCLVSVEHKVLCEHFLDLEAVREALASYNTQFCTARTTLAGS